MRNQPRIRLRPELGWRLRRAGRHLILLGISAAPESAPFIGIFLRLICSLPLWRRRASPAACPPAMTSGPVPGKFLDDRRAGLPRPAGGTTANFKRAWTPPKPGTSFKRRQLMRRLHRERC
jgi:hypothetical protein